MTYMISKDFEFAAAHHLDGLPADHKCARVHGHNYVVRVKVGSSSLNQVGFVIDYADLGFVGDFLREQWDHRDLNDRLYGMNPTAENLAAYLFDVVRAQLGGALEIVVGVSETPKVWAWYRK
jgi:6-pyruvoyltetrahydropterin/6-carboxytetrahydropterin synthase